MLLFVIAMHYWIRMHVECIASIVCYSLLVHDTVIPHTLQLSTIVRKVVSVNYVNYDTAANTAP